MLILLLGQKKNTIKKNTEAVLLGKSKVAGLELNTQKPKYIFLSYPEE